MKRALVALAIASIAAVAAAGLWAGRSQARDLYTRVSAVPKWAMEAKEPVRFAPNEVLLLPTRPNGSRVYLFASIFNGAEMWQDPLYRPLVDRLLADGSQVVLMDSPKTRARFFDDGGAAYCRALIRWVEDTDRRLDEEHPASRKAMMGISFGGYQALMAAARLPWVDAYVALSPVTRIQALGEFWFTDNDRCSPFGDADRLKPKPGLITYGTAESRVNSDYLAEIAVVTDSKRIVYPGRAHVTVGDEYAPAAAFLRSALAPPQ